MDRSQMEAEGARVKKNERLCSREERKRRKTSGLVEEGHASQRNIDLASMLSVIHDDRSSAASGLDVVDRLTYLEQRMQMQEDEIQLLKMALADVLKRLNITEEHQAASTAAASGKRAGVKARPVSLALPSRPAVVTSSAAMKKSSTTPSSGSGRTYSPTPAYSGVRSPPGSAKDSPCKAARIRPSSAASTSKKLQEDAKLKEEAVSLGTRRVTHCKVTMQIYLSPLAKKTGCSEPAKYAATVTTKSRPTTLPSNPQAKNSSTKPEKKKSNPSFSLNLQKTTSSHSTPQETSSYQSPVKSPSQYFQICY